MMTATAVVHHPAAAAHQAALQARSPNSLFFNCAKHR